MNKQLILKTKAAYITHLHCLRNETMDVYLISPDQEETPTQGRQLFRAENGTVYCDFPLFPELANYIPDASLIGNDDGEPITEHELSTYLVNTRQCVLPLFKEEQYVLPFYKEGQKDLADLVVQALSGTENYETMTANVQVQVTFYGTETFTAECKVQLTPLGWEIGGILSRPVDATEESEKDDIYYVFSGYPTAPKSVHVFSHIRQVGSQWIETVTFKSGLAPCTSKFDAGFFLPEGHAPLTQFVKFAKRFYRPDHAVVTGEAPESCRVVDTVIRQVAEPTSIKVVGGECRWAFHANDGACVVFDDVTHTVEKVEIRYFMSFDGHDQYPTYTRKCQEGDRVTRCTIHPGQGLLIAHTRIDRDNFTKDTLQNEMNRLKDYCDCQIEHYKTLYGLDIQNHRDSVIFAN